MNQDGKERPHRLPAKADHVEGRRTVTSLDLRLGLIQLTEEQRDTLARAIFPVFRRAADRLLEQELRRRLAEPGKEVTRCREGSENAR